MAFLGLLDVILNNESLKCKIVTVFPKYNVPVNYGMGTVVHLDAHNTHGIKQALISSKNCGTMHN